MAQNIPLHVATPEIEEALTEKMAQIALKEKEQETEQKAAGLGLGYINLIGFPIGPETIATIPIVEAKRLAVVCFLRTATQIRLASPDPTKQEVVALADALAAKYHAQTEIYVTSEHSLASAMKLYEHLPKIIKYTSDIEIAESDIERFQKKIHDLRDLDNAVKEVSITDTFVFLLAGAIQARASDIHIEAEGEDIRVRFRVDGVLTPVASIQKEKWPRIIARIKLMAGLKLNITTAPQDGRITVLLTNDKVDIRVSTLPTAFGESVVLRLLRSSATSINYDELGLRGRAFDQLKEEVQKPNGMVVVTGPTGSGKTTTLYAILNQLNNDETKIITLEDPIEYKLPGINQSQVDWSKDYTFAKGLRSILRQDPDVIMVGEIRDLETADTAIQAALTGHLVLSTVHTNDAAGAVPRFLSMGTKPFLLAPALNAVVAQRLVRIICKYCHQEEKLSDETLERVKKILGQIPVTSGYALKPDQEMKFQKGAGCDHCHGLGFTGRLGIYEVLQVTDEVEQAILSGSVSEYQMRDIEQHQGMITMVQDGLLKALDGITTVEEVFRVAR